MDWMEIALAVGELTAPEMTEPFGEPGTAGLDHNLDAHNMVDEIHENNTLVGPFHSTIVLC